MKIVFPITILAFLCFPFAARAQTESGQSYMEKYGLRYTLPQSWIVSANVAPLPAWPTAQSSSDEEKRVAKCARLVYSAHHQDLNSVIVVMMLPYSCYGQKLLSKDLPGFTQGAVTGLNEAFQISGPTTANYQLGTHALWIERASVTMKNKQEAMLVSETVCGILDKAAVCWLALAADQAGLLAFEQSTVALDNDTNTALMPADAFQTKP